MRDTLYPTQKGNWFSSSIDSTGNPYGIAEGLIFSFPCQILENHRISIVSGLEIPQFLEAKIKATERELLEERDLIRSLLNWRL